MSAVLAEGMVVELRIFCRQTDQESVNTVHYATSNQFSVGSTLANFLGVVDTIFQGPYISWLTDQAQLRGYTASIISPLPLPATEELISLHNGLAGNQSIPAQVCGLVAFTTALAGKDQRGRVYIPFGDQVSNNNVTNTVSAAGLATLLLLSNAFTQVFTAGGGGGTVDCSPCLWHRDTRTFDLITGSPIRSSWATQKRRGNYGRPNAVFP